MDKKCYFYMTRMQRTGEITPKNWFSVIAMGGEIQMTVEDNATRGKIEGLDEPRARLGWQSEDKRSRPGVPDIRDSYMAVIPVTPQRRKLVSLPNSSTAMAHSSDRIHDR
jgi:hypothetical protein